jgi:hypothetical protein
MRNNKKTLTNNQQLQAEQIIKDICHSDDPLKIKQTLRTLISEVGKKRKFDKTEQFHLRVIMDAISDIVSFKQGGIN